MVKDYVCKKQGTDQKQAENADSAMALCQGVIASIEKRTQCSDAGNNEADKTQNSSLEYDARKLIFESSKIHFTSFRIHSRYLLRSKAPSHRSHFRSQADISNRIQSSPLECIVSLVKSLYNLVGEVHHLRIQIEGI